MFTSHWNIQWCASKMAKAKHWWKCRRLFINYYHFVLGLDSTVSMTMGNEFDGRGSIRTRNKIILFSTASRPALGPTQPSVQRVPVVKRPGRESDHSSATSTEGKVVELYRHSIITTLWCGASLIYHRDNFTSFGPLPLF
jgi:hypothetical protein